MSNEDVLAVKADPVIQVLISRDRMEASLIITLPPNSREVVEQEVLDKIQQSGVKFGIDMNAVQKACRNPGNQMAFAYGQKPVDGVDAKMVYHFDMNNKGKPTELADGSVDFKNINLFTTVQEGDLVAEKIPVVPGLPGTDVLGMPVNGKPGKDIPIPLGKNVSLVENTKLVAAISGQIIVSNNRINITPMIEIKGDVDLSTGNIEFVGNVLVRGNIQAGFSVKAEGNVEVYGAVSGGIVEGRTVLIKMGVQGMNRGYIKAKENVIAKFIENSTVYAGQEVIVNDVILHSRISAGRKILVEGRKGLIAGGQITAGEEIRAKVIGTQLAVATELEVGVNPILREEYQNLRKEIKKIESSLDQTQKSLSLLRGMNQKDLPPAKREMLLKLTKAQFQLAGQVETVKNRLTEIELAFEEMRYGRIRVADNVFPGVKVVVGTQVKPIREPLRYVSFYAEDGEIKIGPFK
ncbi:DUF342 domain-containing protein [Acetonema longum]|uniref:Flagellar Assembly Protein A N-terminal region domain-containing protein n=1 Tax=Acetonema longum DSM 6540 TaxID=1009370 RepID=F7NL72_9FIRM|nr:FapA family protein [Acetonema longum]EGO63177.1 hypothetical protein ALO_14222 [Acetonema longum DSM 6540]